jgi:tyrosinase
MVEIAQSYTSATDKSMYLEAAQKFRLPYWDYYRPRDHISTFPGVVENRKDTKFPYKFGMPQIFTVSEVRYKSAPSNEWKLMPNPLRSFTFPDPKTVGIKDSDWGDIVGSSKFKL